jgi:hypothetical protein
LGEVVLPLLGPLVPSGPLIVYMNSRWDYQIGKLYIIEAKKLDTNFQLFGGHFHDQFSTVIGMFHCLFLVLKIPLFSMPSSHVLL